MRDPAKAIKARRAEAQGVSVHESAVAQPFALTGPFSTTQAGLTTRGETA